MLSDETRARIFKNLPDPLKPVQAQAWKREAELDEYRFARHRAKEQKLLAQVGDGGRKPVYVKGGGAMRGSNNDRYEKLRKIALIERLLQKRRALGLPIDENPLI